MIDRRLALRLILALLAAPLVAEAQPPNKARIGYLSGNPPSDTQEAIDAFRAKLRSLGHVEGQNLLLESRYAEGRYERLPQLAADLVRFKVDAIFTFTTPGAQAAKKATGTIPIVFAGVSDPLTVGLVTSLTRPGGNVTGVTLNNPELSAKRLSLLKEAVPAMSRVAVLANPNFKPSSSIVAETRIAARALGVEIQVLEVREPPELGKAFGIMTAAKADAVVVVPDPMFVAQRQRIVELAASSRMPAIYHLRQFVEAGGLIFYGADYVEAFQQAAVLVWTRSSRARGRPTCRWSNLGGSPWGSTSKPRECWASLFPSRCWYEQIMSSSDGLHPLNSDSANPNFGMQPTAFGRG